jgi:hypothetical protein
VLTEGSEQTLQGLINSTQVLLEATAKDLLEYWHWRRNHPASLRRLWSNGNKVAGFAQQASTGGVARRANLGVTFDHRTVHR